MKKYSLTHRIKEKLVFFLGDVRRIQHFPWVTWDVSQHLMSFEESLEGIKTTRPGDVGLHFDVGYLSNLAIPGFFKHAWIHITDGEDIQKAIVVEAISEGVVKRHALYPMRSDYAIILRPPQDAVNQQDIDLAVKYANRLIGCKYDSSFKFDMEETFINLGNINGTKTMNTTDRNAYVEQLTAEKRREIREATMDELDLTEDEINNLVESKDNLDTSFGSFSCTEVVSFAWWHRRRELKIGRKKYAGRDIIAADDLLNGFDIVWKSKHVTADVVHKKLPEVLTQKIADFKQ